MSARETPAAVWTDPGRCGGDPCIYGTRITTSMAASTVWELGIDEALTCWPHLTPALLRGACWYEARHGARRWRKRWAGWIDTWGDAMWLSDWENVPDPPRKNTEKSATNGCGVCLTCDPPERSSMTGLPMMRMYVCATCGNKRCPASTDCRKWACSGSNDPAQVRVLRPAATDDETPAGGMGEDR